MCGSIVRQAFPVESLPVPILCGQMNCPLYPAQVPGFFLTRFMFHVPSQVFFLVPKNQKILLAIYSLYYFHFSISSLEGAFVRRPRSACFFFTPRLSISLFSTL